MKHIYLLFFFITSCFSDFEKIPEISNESRFPRLSSNDNGEVFLSWFEKVDSVEWSIKSSIFSNKEWTNPKVISKSKPYFINWADFPSINNINQDTLVAHWLEKSGSGTYDYDVHLSFSYDRGSSWSRSEIPHATLVKGEHGFSSFAIGNKFHDVVWLDGREMTMGHGKSDYGQMNLYHTTFSTNGVLGEEYLVDAKVCECCPTSSVRYKENLVIAYRNRDSNEVRDIFIARKIGDEWKKPYPAHNDNWKIAGCPVNGPMLAINKSNIALAWYTAANDSAQVKVAFSKDVGKTFSRPVVIDRSMPIGRVDIEWIDGESVVVSWIRSTEKSSDILARMVNINNDLGKVYFVKSIPQGRISGYPQMEVVGEKMLFAWTEINKKTSVATKWLSLDKLQ